MTASLGNFQNGSYGSNLDGFVYPQFLFDPMRAPTVNDIFPAGTKWLDNSASPKVIYETTGAGNWASVNTSGSFTNLTADGTVDLNTSGAGVTTIGTGGTGAVNIGNATGNTAVTGNLVASGDIETSAGNLIISGAAQQLQVEGGAVTDFIGTATLVAGTVTVANTNIAANDRIIAFHIAPNASTAIGTLTYTISAATSFTIDSLDATASVEVGDLSDVGYLIVRQL